MISTNQLIAIADAYKAAAGIERDQTVSYRVFGDSKKLSAMRNHGAGITLDRFNASVAWFRANWPHGHRMPKLLTGGDHPPANGAPTAPAQAPGRKGAA